MTRSANVSGVALRLIETGLVDARPLVTARVSIHDESGVLRAFTEYGQGASMKTSMLAPEILLAAEPLSARNRAEAVGIGI